MNIKPTKNRVLVELENPPKLSLGGIHIPERLDKGKVKPIAARIVDSAVVHGHGLFRGDRVLVPMFGGFHVDETKRIFKEEEIFGVLTDDAKVGV